ncbi:Retrovirus-related Pol polyprotein from transposon TNT 1-94 [Araneus ventricosus]|uniref:Retrovirus-related Pol polyprotein from transposon TNT 1-94 n=1 Tax=Araneus ventricosus TaxID=182803 RepID=A0A4Y2V0Z2_ARAVE|nr:Retrovirus-related Pol polyprotein from transposon TNT 1-94 [Araneus ventricosus]
MSSYIGKISQAAKDLENAGKVIPDDEIAYQMLANLPRSYDNLVMQLYQLDDKNFTSLNVQKSLLAEYDRVTVREKSEARPKEPAVFSIESDVARKKNSTKEFKERRKWVFFFVELLVILERTAGNSRMPIRCLLINNKLSSSASMAEGTTNIRGKGDVSLEIMDNSGVSLLLKNVLDGVAERYNRTIIEGVRALLHESKLPKNLWAELVNTQNYLRNRFPHKSLKGKAPLNVWSDKKFSVRHFKRIGCVAYVFIPKRYRNKLEPNAQKGIMMGHALNTLGYRIFFPQGGKITETKHVKFNESILGVDSNVQMKDNKFRMVDSFSDFELSSNEIPMPKLSDKTECDWKRVCVTRQKGKSKGRIDVYYYPESKVRLRSKNEVKKYCESKGIDYNPDNFDFSPKLILDNNKLNAIETQSDDFSTDIEDISDSEAHLVDIKIPNNFKESQMVPERENWCNAMKEELEILKVRDVYEIVPRPKNKNVLGNKWVYTLKKDVTGKIKRYRARLVTQGFRQIEGIDYFDTFSPVINFTLVRLFIVILVTMKGWLCNHLDIKSAYLYAPLNEDIFMEQPSGFVIDNENNSVFKLKKALYGLKQAGREWYSELNNSLIELGFEKLLSSNCIYVYKSFVLLLVYVDDIAIFACNEKYMNEVIGLIKSKFDVKDLGKLS